MVRYISNTNVHTYIISYVLLSYFSQFHESLELTIGQKQKLANANLHVRVSERDRESLTLLIFISGFNFIKS